MPASSRSTAISACWKPNGSMSLRRSMSSSSPRRGSAWPTVPRYSFPPSTSCRAAVRTLHRSTTPPCITPARKCRPIPILAPIPACEVMSEAPTVFQRRIIIGAVLSVAAFALVGIRLADVTLLKSLDGVRAAGAVIARADLTDRNGELLARDLPVKDLYARPHVFWDKAQAAHDLAVATGADERRLLNGFNNAKHPYVLIARQISPAVEAKVMHLGLPGLEFEDSGKRYYPDGRNAAQVVGVTDPDNNGVSGLELGLEKQIRQAAGGKVATSIDMRVQYILAHEVEEARHTFTARAAGGIVMDVNTGEVLAMVSSPDFDPNQRRLSQGDSSRNIMAQDVYELGSVFKIFT